MGLTWLCLAALALLLQWLDDTIASCMHSRVLPVSVDHTSQSSWTAELSIQTASVLQSIS